MNRTFLELIYNIDLEIYKLKDTIKQLQTIKSNIYKNMKTIKKDLEAANKDIEKIYISTGGSAYIRFKQKNKSNKNYVFRFSTHKHKKNGSTILKNYIYGD